MLKASRKRLRDNPTTSSAALGSSLDFPHRRKKDRFRDDSSSSSNSEASSPSAPNSPLANGSPRSTSSTQRTSPPRRDSPSSSPSTSTRSSSSGSPPPAAAVFMNPAPNVAVVVPPTLPIVPAVPLPVNPPPQVPPAANIPANAVPFAVGGAAIVPPPLPPVAQHQALARRRDDVLWYLLARKHIHGLSTKQFDYIFEDADSLKPGLHDVSKSDVALLEAEILRPYRRFVFFRCACGEDVSNENDLCGNMDCAEDLKKRGTISERIRFSSFDICEQIGEIVQQEIANIVSHRRLVHANRKPDNDEYRNSLDFESHIENAADFAQNRIRLALLLNTDGFSPDKNYNGSIWPVIMAILDIEPSKRYAAKRLVTAGLLRTPNHPSVEEVNTLMRRLRGQCANRSVDVILGQDVYKVTWVVAHTSCDSEAYRTAYDASTHASGKCIFCDIQAIRLAGAYRYPMECGNIKDDAYIRLHAVLGTGGFGSLSVLQRICPSSRALADLLHTFDEGLAKFLCLELKKGARLAALKLAPAVQEEIQRMCSTTRLHTYFSGRLLDLKHLSSSCGKDIRLHCFVTIPLACLLGKVRNEEVAMMTMCIVNLQRTLLNTGLRKADVDEISDGLISLRDFWDPIFTRATSTSKAHNYLVHLPEMLRRMGNVIELDCCGFEHQNLMWKKPLASQNTKGFDTSMEDSMLMQLRVVEEVCERGEDTVVPGLHKIFTELEHNRSKGMRKYVSFGDELRLPSSPLAVPTPPNPKCFLFTELSRLATGVITEYYSRVWWRSSTVSSHEFWPRPPKSQQDIVVCTRNGRNFLGTVKLFGKSGNDLFILLHLFDTSDITSSLFNKVRVKCVNGNNPHLLELLEVYRTFVFDKQYIRKVQPGGPGVYMSFHVSELSARGCIVHFFGNDYFVILPSRAGWS